MNIQSSAYGTTKEGEAVTKYVLTNDHGHSVGIITYGGAITEICVPNKEGIIENVVLAHNSLEAYEEHKQFFGCITGRVAGRISGAEFTINNETYSLAKNDNNNCLHGGVKGLDKVVWSAAEVIEKDFVGLSLNHLSYDMEEGFPGNLDMTVTYRWNNENELSLTYKATTDKETLITLTNHTYFNLSGNPTTTVLDHELQIDADRYIEVTDACIPCNISSVEDTPFDFRKAKPIGQDIHNNNIQLTNGMGYDHPWILNGNQNPCIHLTDLKSGRTIDVSTDEACLVCYTGNHLEGFTAFDQITLQKRSAVCLETQYYPDNANFNQVPTKTLKPNQLYKQTTIFKFGVRPL